MKILKGYIKNLHHLEASIVERYIIEEANEFCTEYIEKAKLVGRLESWHDERGEGKVMWFHVELVGLGSSSSLESFAS